MDPFYAPKAEASHQFTPYEESSQVAEPTHVEVVLVPSAMHVAAGSHSPSAMGTLLGIISGTLFGTFGIFSRVLGRAGAASPPMLVSYYMVVIEVGTAGLALLALALGPETAPPWASPAWSTHDGRGAPCAAAPRRPAARAPRQIRKAKSPAKYM